MSAFFIHRVKANEPAESPAARMLRLSINGCANLRAGLEVVKLQPIPNIAHEDIEAAQKRLDEARGMLELAMRATENG